ncbi:hypothetical protein FGB62_49g223 [Gracilaria domingensis]|nr:hypothetical protein FGB62_49g223 [Gracilaria domingensis]
MFNIGHFLFRAASDNERRHLVQVYGRVLQIPIAVEEHVQAALLLEIIEDFDHRSWPKHFQLSGIEWNLQHLVHNACESTSVDGRQRESYLRLIMASKGRHRDLAHGLSERLVWRQKRDVVEKLITMGKRNYHAPVPTNYVAENHIFHVAVSYKHTSAYYDQGTISRRQAESIWATVRSVLVFFGEEDTEVRVWIDQNLHRTKFPEDRKWHEFGLLPYACLKTVFVGEGDCSLRLARTRPWLWVEMVTALHAEGIYVKPGLDISIHCDGMLEHSENYDNMKCNMMRYGWFIGNKLNVDDTMNITTRFISLWRREFLDHRDYEWAEEFELFVNWARRFVIRSVPYSEMTWDHSSDPVCGMDAVVLLRALPAAEPRGFLRGAIYWKRENKNEKWVLDDIIDRSLVEELPLSDLLEFKKDRVEGYEEITLFGMSSSLENTTFRRNNQLVSMVIREKYSSREYSTHHFSATSSMLKALRMSTEKVVITLPRAHQALMSYVPFTDRVFCAHQGRMAVGDACLRPAVVRRSVEEDLKLERSGTCYNSGICEQVYTVCIDEMKLLLSTNEVDVLHSACNGNVVRFKEMVRILKTCCTYKPMKCRDRNEDELLYYTRGRRLDNFEAKDLKNCCFISGEPDKDIENELIQIMRSQYEGYTLVWIDRAYAGKVRVTFRESHQITVLKTSVVASNTELAILKETDHDKLVNSESTGLVEMAVGIQPKVSAKAYGSGLNPRIMTHENGKEIELFAVEGIFSTCDLCNRAVCNLNGLTASVREESNLLHVQWLGKHTCSSHGYTSFAMKRGNRIV